MGEDSQGVGPGPSFKGAGTILSLTISGVAG